jgi:hypothetical protein
MDVNIEQCVCMKFVVKIGKSATGTNEMLREDPDNILRPGRVCLNDIHVSRPVECQLKMMGIQGDQAQAKGQKMLKGFQNSSPETVAACRPL